MMYIMHTFCDERSCIQFLVLLVRATSFLEHWASKGNMTDLSSSKLELSPSVAPYLIGRGICL